MFINTLYYSLIRLSNQYPFLLKKIRRRHQVHHHWLPLHLLLTVGYVIAVINFLILKYIIWFVLQDKWNKPSGTIKNKGVILKKACTGRKAKRNRNSTQTQQYFCPKCEINYDDDIGGGEWVQCSKSDTCTTWGHVNCMEASFICETCRSHN